MNQKLLDYSRVISVMAQQDVLGSDVADHFCKAVLPQLLAELDVMARLADVRIAAALDIPQPVAPQEPQECEATVCSSRWAKNQEKVPAKKAKKARKKTRARKPKNEHADA
jgi:hypothetical protein